ncbi:2-hydroxychromene-2-carboxylate isomerase [Variovorax sp. E3]|uniref:2-hydroxychromene-2-carboxylate isomerase n=1 Tax=Variovorax sp. E3 TaxID=1914993 RepID=UPI0027DD9132|nr:2-hydroxychromene-2-carboxylate isomerase [Variovorax sp. E3]
MKETMLKVKFIFDFGSPNAYLCHKVLPAISARTGAEFEYVPVLLGGIFKLTGNQSPATAFAAIKNKPEYDKLELRRFIQRHGITMFTANPHFPVNTLQLMRGAVAAESIGVLVPYVEAIYAGMWERGLKLDDPAVFGSTLIEAGLPTVQLLDLIKTEPIKSELMANTEAAVAAGAFGSPTFLLEARSSSARTACAKSKKRSCARAASLLRHRRHPPDLHRSRKEKHHVGKECQEGLPRDRRWRRGRFRYRKGICAGGFRDGHHTPGSPSG